MRGLAIALLSVLCFSGIAEAGRRGGAGIPPNIIFIMVDDIGADAISAFNSPYNYQLAAAVAAGAAPTDAIPLPSVPNTPNLDALLANGVNFPGMWAGSACLATRQMLLTGHLINTGREDYGIEAVDGMGNQPRVIGGLPQPTMDDDSLGHQISSQGYFVGSGGNKCLVSQGPLTSGAAIKDVDLSNRDGTCGGAGTGGPEVPTRAKTYQLALDKAANTWTSHTYENTDTSDPSLWFPRPGISTSGFTTGGNILVDTMLDVLETEVFSATPGINHQPYYMAIQLPGGHDTPYRWAGHYDASLHPSAALLSHTANAGANAEALTTLPAPAAGSSYEWYNTANTTLPSGCGSDTVAQYNAATHNYFFSRTDLLHTHECLNRLIEIWDAALGRLVTKLGPKRLENTYIVFSGDNPSDRQYGWGYQSSIIFGDTEVAPAGNLEWERTPDSCWWDVPQSSPWYDAAVHNPIGANQVGQKVGCGKGDWGESLMGLHVPLAIGYGPIPTHSRGQESRARLWTVDLHEGLLRMVDPHGIRRMDGYDLSKTWGKDCVDWGDFTSDCHSVRGSAANYTGIWDETIPSIYCRTNIIAEDPQANGDQFVLERSRCRADYFHNLSAANPWEDLRPLADPANPNYDSAIATQYSRVLALLQARRSPLAVDDSITTVTGGGGQKQEGPCNYNGTCPP